MNSDPNSALEVMRIIPLIVIAAGILTALVCRPLIQGKVKPNRLYGIRTPLAFSSEENWYKVNRFGGWLLYRSGIFMVVVGVVGLPLPQTWLIGYAVVAAVLVIGSVLGTAIRILRGP
jgi:uncharacterized membrane protein